MAAKRKTEISLVQDALHQSEARFQAMFNQSVIGIGMLGLDGRIQDANSAVCRMLGRSLDELHRIPFTEMIHPDEREFSGEQFRQLLAGETTSYRVQRRYLRKDGGIFWANVTVSMVCDKHGRPQFAVGLMEDIDEQKRIETELHASQAQLAEREADDRRLLERKVEERTHALTEANRRLQKEIEHRQSIEQALSGKAVEKAVTTERSRLARDLHDAVTQTLFSASLIAEVLPDLWRIDPEEGRRSTEELKQLTRGALAEMRTLLLELRPDSLTKVRFEDLLKQLTEGLIGRARLPIELNVAGQRKLPPEVQVALYRIAQESLNNVVKYAQASAVEVWVEYSPNGVQLIVADNGIGFEIGNTKPASLGLRIMRERAEAIRAEVTIDSRPGQGTRVTAAWTEEQKKRK